MHADGEIVHGNDFSINDRFVWENLTQYLNLKNPKIKLFLLGTGLLD
jgi:hypothetical protein